MIDVNAMLAEVRDANVKERLRVTFVSVDPNRDTTELAQYVPFFNKDFVGVTDAELAKPPARLTRSTKLVNRMLTAGTLWITPAGCCWLIHARYTAVFGDKPKPKVMAHDLETIIRSYSG